MNSAVQGTRVPSQSHLKEAGEDRAPTKTKEPKVKGELKRQRAHLLEGRGTGAGADYRPFIQIERSGFQSRGRSHLVFNETIGRFHHLLSDLELLIFLWIWSLRPVDCREQFPLQVYEYDPAFPLMKARPRGTAEIAGSLGFKHPQITKTDPRVMTTDFLVNFRDATLLSIHAKYLKEIEEGPERAQQLRSIERTYWGDRKVRHIVMTETPFTSRLATRMMWAIDGMKWLAKDINVNSILDLLSKTPSEASFGDRLGICAHRLGLSDETVVIGFKYAVLTRLWIPQNPSQDYDLGLPWPGKRARTHNATSSRTCRMPGL
jgi:hypothetical protein